MLIPYMDFNSEQFLKIYYKIFSFEDGLNWLDKNKSVPLGTKIRIINSCLNAFGQLLEIFDNRLVLFFIEYIKKKEIKYIYSGIAQYIGIDRDTITIISKYDNELKPTEKCVERMNFMVKKFFDIENITKFMYRYFKHRKNTWDDIQDHLQNMVQSIIEYIINKIEKKE